MPQIPVEFWLCAGAILALVVCLALAGLALLYRISGDESEERKAIR